MWKSGLALAHVARGRGRARCEDPRVPDQVPGKPAARAVPGACGLARLHCCQDWTLQGAAPGLVQDFFPHIFCKRGRGGETRCCQGSQRSRYSIRKGPGHCCVRVSGSLSSVCRCSQKSKRQRTVNHAEWVVSLLHTPAVQLGLGHGHSPARSAGKGCWKASGVWSKMRRTMEKLSREESLQS